MSKNERVSLSTGGPVGAIGALLRHARHPARADPGPDAGRRGIDLSEAAEIDSLLAAVGTSGLDLAHYLSRRLGPLVQRSVPPRVIEAAPVPRAARLRFADGTTVVVKSVVSGDVAILALAMLHGSVKTAACRTGGDGSTQLLFTWLGGQRELSLRVVGLDQPD